MLQNEIIFDNKNNIEKIHFALIDLYQRVKIRKESEAKLIDLEFINSEKEKLKKVSCLDLILYIKTHLELLINIKVNEKIKDFKIHPEKIASFFGTDDVNSDYEMLLRRYENDIRNYIKVENMLKIYIEDLKYKIELNENEIEKLKKIIDNNNNNNINNNNIINNKISNENKNKNLNSKNNNNNNNININNNINNINNSNNNINNSNNNINNNLSCDNNNNNNNKNKTKKFELNKLDCFYTKNKKKLLNSKLEKYEKITSFSSKKNKRNLSTFLNFSFYKTINCSYHHTKKILNKNNNNKTFINHKHNQSFLTLNSYKNKLLNSPKTKRENSEKLFESSDEFKNINNNNNFLHFRKKNQISLKKTPLNLSNIKIKKNSNKNLSKINLTNNNNNNNISKTSRYNNNNNNINKNIKIPKSYSIISLRENYNKYIQYNNNNNNNKNLYNTKFNFSNKKNLNNMSGFLGNLSNSNLRSPILDKSLYNNHEKFQKNIKFIEKTDLKSKSRIRNFFINRIGTFTNTNNQKKSKSKIKSFINN